MMRDNKALVFRCKYFTIWYDDADKWPKRARHGDPKVYEAIKKDFEFSWDASYGGWFNEQQDPCLSTMGIVLDMFHTAAWHHFKRSRRKRDRFIRKHLVDILHFAENPFDSAHHEVTNHYDKPPREERIRMMISMVYGCVLRWDQRWYQNPRWHFWHWEIRK